MLAALEAGEATIAIGTHALFQKGVKLARLGLAVVDEQHRFGVEQRLMLRRKADGGVPHLQILPAQIGVALQLSRPSHQIQGR